MFVRVCTHTHSCARARVLECWHFIVILLFEIESNYGLELLVLLMPQRPHCGDNRCKAPHKASRDAFAEHWVRGFHASSDWTPVLVKNLRFRKGNFSLRPQLISEGRIQASFGVSILTPQPDLRNTIYILQPWFPLSALTQ